MKHVYTKADLMKLNQYYALKSLTQEKLTPTKTVKEPPKPNENQLIIKKTIELFFQSTPIVDFDPSEQFLKLQRIPVTQEKFSLLLTDVVFKKTKDKVDWAKNFLFLKSKKPSPQLQESSQQQPKMQPLKINRYKFLVDIMANIKMSCSRLQQLLYNMIDLHEWRCQQKNNCKEVYMEGYLAKLLFKKVIVPSGIFQPEQALFKGLISHEKEDKLSGLEEKSQVVMIDRKLPKQADVISLKNEILRWGPELLVELIKQKVVPNTSLDQKPSSQSKYFICKQCFCRENNIDLNEGAKKKNKKKNKSKQNQVNTVASSIADTSQDQASNDPSRKNSTIQIEDLTTTEEKDEELQFETQKYYEKVSNFLEDLRIDVDARSEIRLRRTEDSDDECQQGTQKENRLLARMRSILYKTHPNLK